MKSAIALPRLDHLATMLKVSACINEFGGSLDATRLEKVLN